MPAKCVFFWFFPPGAVSYCFCLPAVGGDVLRKTMATTFTTRTLTNPEDQAYGSAWKEFFLNFNLVRHLLDTGDANLIEEVCTAGLQWDGQGWSTARATAKLYELTKVALVSDDINEYKLSFLFSLALAGKVEVPTLKLTERSSDAALRLFEIWTLRTLSGVERGDPSRIALMDEDGN